MRYDAELAGEMLQRYNGFLRRTLDAPARSFVASRADERVVEA